MAPFLHPVLAAALFSVFLASAQDTYADLLARCFARSSLTGVSVVLVLVWANVEAALGLLYKFGCGPLRLLQGTVLPLEPSLDDVLSDIADVQLMPAAKLAIARSGASAGDNAAARREHSRRVLYSLASALCWYVALHAVVVSDSERVDAALESATNFSRHASDFMATWGLVIGMLAAVATLCLHVAEAPARLRQACFTTALLAAWPASWLLSLAGSQWVITAVVVAGFYSALSSLGTTVIEGAPVTWVVVARLALLIMLVEQLGFESVLYLGVALQIVCSTCVALYVFSPGVRPAVSRALAYSLAAASGFVNECVPRALLSTFAAQGPSPAQYQEMVREAEEHQAAVALAASAAHAETAVAAATTTDKRAGDVDGNGDTGDTPAADAAAMPTESKGAESDGARGRGVAHVRLASVAEVADARPTDHATADAADSQDPATDAPPGTPITSDSVLLSDGDHDPAEATGTGAGTTPHRKAGVTTRLARATSAAAAGVLHHARHRGAATDVEAKRLVAAASSMSFAVAKPTKAQRATSERLVSLCLLVFLGTITVAGGLLIVLRLLSDITALSADSVRAVQDHSVWDDPSWDAANATVPWHWLPVAPEDRDLEAFAKKYVAFGRDWLVDHGKESIVGFVADTVLSGALNHSQVDDMLDDVMRAAGLTGEEGGGTGADAAALGEADDGSVGGDAAPGPGGNDDAALQGLARFRASIGRVFDSQRYRAMLPALKSVATSWAQPLMSSVAVISGGLLQANMALLSGALDGVMTLIQFIVNVVIFTVTLVYMLQASVQRRIRTFLPEMLIAGKEQRERLAQEIADTIHGTLSVTLKRPLYYGVCMWLTLVCYDVGAFVGPCMWALVSAFIALTWGDAGPWLVAPAALELWLLGRTASAVSVFAVHSVVQQGGAAILDSLSTSSHSAAVQGDGYGNGATRPAGVPVAARKADGAGFGRNPYLLALSIYGGWLCLDGLWGVVLGPLCVCLLSVSMDLLAAIDEEREGRVQGAAEAADFAVTGAVATAAARMRSVRKRIARRVSAAT